MKSRKGPFFILLAFSLTVMLLLASGAPMLDLVVCCNGQLPLGNVLTWAGMLAWSIAVYLGFNAFSTRTNKWTKVLLFVLKAVVILATLWFPMSYLLAGNLSFTFSEKAAFQGGQLAMRLFWGWSIGIGISPLLVLLLYWCSLPFIKRPNSRP